MTAVRAQAIWDIDISASGSGIARDPRAQLLGRQRLVCSLMPVRRYNIFALGNPRSMKNLDKLLLLRLPFFI